MWSERPVFIATHEGMNTTAGSYSLLNSVVPNDAGVVKRLRKAGAIILGTFLESVV
jgi:amidase